MKNIKFKSENAISLLALVLIFVLIILIGSVLIFVGIKIFSSQNTPNITSNQNSSNTFQEPIAQTTSDLEAIKKKFRPNLYNEKLFLKPPQSYYLSNTLYINPNNEERVFVYDITSNSLFNYIIDENKFITVSVDFSKGIEEATKLSKVDTISGIDIYKEFESSTNCYAQLKKENHNYIIKFASSKAFDINIIPEIMKCIEIVDTNTLSGIVATKSDMSKTINGITIDLSNVVVTKWYYNLPRHESMMIYLDYIAPGDKLVNMYIYSTDLQNLKNSIDSHNKRYEDYSKQVLHKFEISGKPFYFVENIDLKTQESYYEKNVYLDLETNIIQFNLVYEFGTDIYKVTDSMVKSLIEEQVINQVVF